MVINETLFRSRPPTKEDAYTVAKDIMNCCFGWPSEIYCPWVSKFLRYKGCLCLSCTWRLHQHPLLAGDLTSTQFFELPYYTRKIYICLHLFMCFENTIFQLIMNADIFFLQMTTAGQTPNYIMGYVGISLAGIVVIIASTLLLTLAAYKASITFHKKMLNTVVKFPLR